MAIENDDAALSGGEQPPAPAAPAPAEPAPNETARQTVRKAFEQAQAKAAEKDEARAPHKDVEDRTDRHNQILDEEKAKAEGKPLIDRTRDQQGRFVRGEGQEQAQVETGAPKAPTVDLPIPETAEERAAVALRPPPGWSAAARAQFGMLPPEVKEAVARREAEVTTGFQALQKYKGLETYTPMIEGSGISHAEFTKRAVEWEQSLKTNPVGTLLHVAKLGGVDIVRVAQMIQQQVDQIPQQRTPAQQTAVQAYQNAYPQQQQPQQPDYKALIHQELAEREAHGTVDEFLADPKNIHAEAVADDMALLITNGRADNLEQAYDMACWAHPEIRALLIREASAKPGAVSETDRARRQASEARAAAKATIGAPSGPRPEPKDEPSDKSVRGTVRWAYDKAREQA